MNSETSNKIVVIGAGNVGETICYTLMLRAQVGEIVLIDVNEKKAKGAALDISHGTAFYSQVRIKQGGYEECADAKIIIVTAGVARKEGQTRLDLAKVNTGIARDIARKHHAVREEPADYRCVQPGRRKYLPDPEGDRTSGRARYRNRYFSGYRTFPLPPEPPLQGGYPAISRAIFWASTAIPRFLYGAV